MTRVKIDFLSQSKGSVFLQKESYVTYNALNMQDIGKEYIYLIDNSPITRNPLQPNRSSMQLTKLRNTKCSTPGVEHWQTVISDY